VREREIEIERERERATCIGHLKPPARLPSITLALSKWLCMGFFSNFDTARLRMPILPSFGGLLACPGSIFTYRLID
jgi:hypothetical protein